MGQEACPGCSQGVPEACAHSVPGVFPGVRRGYSPSVLHVFSGRSRSVCGVCTLSYTFSRSSILGCVLRSSSNLFIKSGKGYIAYIVSEIQKALSHLLATFPAFRLKLTTACRAFETFSKLPTLSDLVKDKNFCLCLATNHPHLKLQKGEL